MGKQLLFDALRHQDTERVPWVPFAGIHAGKLAKYTAQEILLDGDKLFESLMQVHKLYLPDGMPVMFDLQLEAEVLGCELLWAEYAPPSVMSHPLEHCDEVPCKCQTPTAKDGRIPLALDVMRRVKAAVGEDTALYGLTTGPLTLASHLRGTQLFRDMKKNPEYAQQLFEYCNAVNIAMADMYIDAGMDVIAVVDPVLSQISATHFETFLLAPYSELFAHIRARGAFAAFFVCGDATRNIEVMCKTAPDCIAVDENVDMSGAKAITDRYNITLCGNIPLTTTMLFGTQQENMQYALHMLDTLDHHNLIIAPGCDMPYDIPVENTVGVVQALHQPEQVREMLKNYQAPADDIEIELPDYANLPRPLLEAFTLDSASCAACTYMWAAVCDAKQHFGDAIDTVEYKYLYRENIARCKKVGVQHLPSLYINGELKYSSLIPEREELFAEVEKALHK